MDDQPAASDSGPPRATRMRECPHCLSDGVTLTGPVTETSGGIRVRYQCHDCSKEFVVLR
jgi:transposase-like protein